MIGVEAPLNNYVSTISTIRMVNELLESVGTPLPNKEIAMMEVTNFCKNVVLDAIWNHLRFRDPGQLWELLSVVFEHFLICVERLDIDEYHKSDGVSPGSVVLKDILGKPSLSMFGGFKSLLLRKRNHFQSYEILRFKNL